MATKFSHQLFRAILVFLVLHPFGANSENRVLESLQNDLKHAQKGDVVNGVHQVKKFLRTFGYYPGEINLLDDRFDDALVAGLSVFRELYHLNVTGRVDSNTIEAMKTPRCGVPDVNISKTSNGAHNHGVFRFVADYSFFLGRPRWSKYSFSTRVYPAQLVEHKVLNLEVVGSSPTEDIS
ncbi:Non-LTR retroelement reverse transcriptase-like [Hibiscus syriacus]|uniref:Non-LTR retroelement reverse transcriptase-like n=1 Tax=Hibiscus syriacus TaxID=106335 RepID=A0A6A2X5X6_HIBSY|nr:Non-LTR retroelement reverse transcriptase-like [Hibiscus syriacus]